MDKPMPKDLIDELEKLEPADQVRVLDYVQSACASTTGLLQASSELC